MHSVFNTGYDQHSYTVCFADVVDCLHNTKRLANFAEAAPLVIHNIHDL